MDGDQGARAPVGLVELAAVLKDFHGTAKDGARGRSAEAGDILWLDDAQFRPPPRSARADLGAVRLVMQAALALGLPFEVLHRIGDVAVVAGDAGFLEGAIEKFPGRADERLAG